MTTKAKSAKLKRGIRKGLVHIYTGDGKGKTTAAFGLAVRASGAGLRVGIFQFIKGASYSENDIFKNIHNITIVQCGRGCFIKTHPSPEDINAALRGLRVASRNIKSGKYDLVILDEVNVALRMGLINIEDIIQLIIGKPLSLELVLTGRNCPKTLFRYADLITEMRKIKHPFDEGIVARKGIEF